MIAFFFRFWIGKLELAPSYKFPPIGFHFITIQQLRQILQYSVAWPSQSREKLAVESLFIRERVCLCPLLKAYPRVPRYRVFFVSVAPSCALLSFIVHVPSLRSLWRIAQQRFKVLVGWRNMTGHYFSSVGNVACAQLYVPAAAIPIDGLALFVKIVGLPSFHITTKL